MLLVAAETIVELTVGSQIWLKALPQVENPVWVYSGLQSMVKSGLKSVLSRIKSMIKSEVKF